jgi:hypothetical protein
MRWTVASRRPLPWILLLAVLLRLLLFLAIAPHPDRFYSNDSPSYVDLGMNLAEGFGSQEGELFSLGLFRTPGYPVVIAGGFTLTGDAPWGVILLQIAVGVLTVWVTYVLALRLVRPEAAASAALALAVDPISIILANYLQPETIFTFLLVAGTLLWCKGLQEHSVRWGAGAGALFGIATLVRPVGLYLPIALIPVSLLLYGGQWLRRLVFTLVLVVSFAIPVGGWIARNANVTGVPLLTTADGVSLLYFRAALAVAEDEGIPFQDAQDRLRASFQRQVRPGLNPAQVSRLERSMAIEVLLQRPVASLKTMAEGATLTLIGPGRAELLQLLGDPTPTEISGPVQILLIAAEVAIYGIILIGAVFGCYVVLRTRKYFAAAILLGLIAYFVLATAVGSTGYSRYRVPIMPFIAIMAGAGYSALPILRSRRSKP